jgi:hypothetical protein
MEYQEAMEIMEDVFKKAEFAYEKNAAANIRIRGVEGGYGFKKLKQDRKKWREALDTIINQRREKVMEYQEAAELFESVLEAALNRMRLEGHPEKQIERVKDAFDKVRNG